MLSFVGCWISQGVGAEGWPARRQSWRCSCGGRRWRSCRLPHWASTFASSPESVLDGARSRADICVSGGGDGLGACAAATPPPPPARPRLPGCPAAARACAARPPRWAAHLVAEAEGLRVDRLQLLSGLHNLLAHHLAPAGMRPGRAGQQATWWARARPGRWPRARPPQNIKTLRRCRLRGLRRPHARTPAPTNPPELVFAVQGVNFLEGHALGGRERVRRQLASPHEHAGRVSPPAGLGHAGARWGGRRSPWSPARRTTQRLS